MPPGSACVKVFRRGDMEIEIANTEGKTIPQVCKELGLKFDDSAWTLNGVRLSASEAAKAKVHAGDNVRQAVKGDQGV